MNRISIPNRSAPAGWRFCRGAVAWFQLLAVVVAGAMLLAFPAAGQALDKTSRISVDSAGAQANGQSYGPVLSEIGHYAVFYSSATNLVSDDTNTVRDVFMRDRVAGRTTLVSVNSAGEQGNGHSFDPSVSSDGRYVTFESAATNLVDEDTNNHWDIFVRDRGTGQTTRVSVGSSGVQAADDSEDAMISGDGSSVAFSSRANNLVTNDNNGVWDIFAHDRGTGQTTRVSVDSNGIEAGASSDDPSISADGRYVAFESEASNLVGDDTNSRLDVFVHDRSTGQTARVSVDSSGGQVSGDSGDASISGDGRYVAFESGAATLVAGDTNGLLDVFVHDRQTGQTTRVSVDSSGGQANGSSNDPSISGDGRYVAFYSSADNLVEGDDNEKQDIFIHDRQSGETIRVSVDSDGGEANGHSYWPSISGDGRSVAFISGGSNLVSGDDNGVDDAFVHGPPLNFVPSSLLLKK